MVKTFKQFLKESKQLKPLLLITLDDPDDKGNRVIKDFNSQQEVDKYVSTKLSSYVNVDVVDRNEYIKRYKQKPDYHEEVRYFLV